LGCTVYMDGVFDLFHVGHLEAIRQCAALGDRVVVGVTGDSDAAGYKRPPIIPEADRAALIAAVKGVDKVVSQSASQQSINQSTNQPANGVVCLN
jgi:glycerol-3-phosphate cytidylyltransferase